ncbi:hypothetical protein BJV74DRAFT_887900 [Russula compacta]|nr:hypothetical protein BJV74DRAFT_887900 [Russula compacta]
MTMGFWPYIRQFNASHLNGTPRPSLILENFQEVENRKLGGSDRDKAEEMTARALGSIHVAGADSVRRWTNTLDNEDALEPYHHFLDHCCYDVVCRGGVTYPDMQRKARDELDSVAWRQRLSNFEDCATLPFIGGVCKEVLRWHPVTSVALYRHDVFIFSRFFALSSQLRERERSE